MKIILIIACLSLSFLLPAWATEYLSLPWLENVWHKMPLAKRAITHLGPIANYAGDEKFMSEYKALILDRDSPIPADIKEALQSIKSPVATSFLAYCRLYNRTIDENNYSSKGIAWIHSVIRIHQADGNDKKTGAVTGWVVGSGSDYQKVKAFKTQSRAFIGRWTKHTEDSPMEFSWQMVGEHGETPKKEGYDRFKGTEDPDNHTICGDWEGYCASLKDQDMESQYGSLRIIVGSLADYSFADYSFDMNTVNLDEETAKKSIYLFKAMESIFGPKFFPYFFTYKEQEQLVAYYVHEAWENYKDNLPQKLKNKETDITKKFMVNLKEKFKSAVQKDFVPAQFGILFQDPTKPRQYSLNIAYDFFSIYDIDTAISKIAHEVIGHGIIHRDDYVYIPISFFKLGDKNRRPEVPSEGFATCVEYNVLESIYNKKGENFPYSNLETFADAVYKKDKQGYYRPGVDLLKNQGYIKNNKIDWNELDNNLNSCKNITQTLKFNFN